MSADIASGWRERNLILRDTPLEDAVHELNLYSRMPITLPADETLRASRLNGVFHLDDREAFLHALESVLPVRVIRLSDGSVAIEPLGSIPPS